MLDNQVLVFELSENSFAVDLDYVLEIIRMPKCVKLPNTSENVRGVINLRNRIIPMFDIRKSLGFKSLDSQTNEMISMLKEREQDHINWVEELMLSVKEKREFKLTTDPRMCKFGKWYYSFKSSNIVLTNYLSYFEAPHNVIHALGIRVKELTKANKYDEALDIINHAKDTELVKIIQLFSDLYKIIEHSSQEFAVIIKTDSGLKAFNTDKIERIASVPAENYEKLEDEKFDGFVKEAIKFNESLILKLDIAGLLN